MRIAVIGAGLAGVCTAHELALAGHEVTVFDRHASVAAEASFANGGLVATGYAAAWDAPGLPRRLWSPPGMPGAGWLGQGASPGRWSMLWRWRGQHRPALQAARRERRLALSRLSQARMAHHSQALRLERERSPGLLVLLRHARALQSLQAGIEWLGQQGQAAVLLDAEAARRLEPGLNPDTPLHAALHLPGDEAANSRQFAHQLRAAASALGVQWRFQHELLRLTPGQPMQLHCRVDHDPLPGGATDGPIQAFTADAVVVCAANGVPTLCRDLGLRMPWMQVHGHSITAPARLLDGIDEHLPRAGLLDEGRQVSITRLGNRVRVAGGARLGAGDGRPRDADLRPLYQVLNDWFPAAAHTARALQWQGTRLMLPDGDPLIGVSPLPGLWFNTGHGAAGWTMACGAAQLLTAQLSGREPPMDPTGFGWQRLR